MRKQIVVMATVALATAVVVLGAVMVGVNLAGDKTPSETSAENLAAVLAESIPPEVPKTIAIPGYAQLVMKAGDIMQHIELHNPAENPCYFVISIILPDGTEVFRSGLIAPGQKRTPYGYPKHWKWEPTKKLFCGTPVILRQIRFR